MDAILQAASCSSFCKVPACDIPCLFCLVFFKNLIYGIIYSGNSLLLLLCMQTLSLSLKVAFHSGFFSQMKVVNFNVVYFNQFPLIMNTLLLKYLSSPE